MITTITGYLQEATGEPAEGSAVVSWPSFTVSGNSIAGGHQAFDIVEGNLTVSLQSNGAAHPVGTYYTVRYELQSGPIYEEYWIVPESTEVTLEQVRANFPPAPSLAVSPIQISGGGAEPGMILAWDGHNWRGSWVHVENVDPNFIRFETGTTGTDFWIEGSPAKLGGTARFNLPDASVTARGVVTTGPQTFGGDKTFANNVAVQGELTGPTITSLDTRIDTLESGAGSYVPTSRQIIAGTGLTGGGDLSADRTLAVVNDTTTQRIEVAKAGTQIGSARKQINFIEGVNIGLTITDQTSRIDVQISAAAGGGAAPVPETRMVIAGTGLTGGGALTTDVTLSADMNYLAAKTHTHAAADVTSGIFATGRLGSGTGSASNFLRGDGSWAVLPAQPQTPWTSHIDAAGYELRNAGKIGIATASPAGLLHVVTANNTNPAGISAFDSRHVAIGPASGGLCLSYDQTNNVGIIQAIQPGVAWGKLCLGQGTFSSYVGINTLNPTAPLHITEVNAAGVDAITAIKLDRAYGDVGDRMDIVWPGSARISACAYTGAGMCFDFYAQKPPGGDGTTNHVVRMQGDGRVGIGCTDPTYSLDVAGDDGPVRLRHTTQSGAGIWYQSNDTYNRVFLGMDIADSVHFRLFANYGSPANMMDWNLSNRNVRMAGNLGIGRMDIDPPERLWLSGGNRNWVRMDDSTNGVIANIGVENGAGYMGTQTNHDMVIRQNNGNCINLSANGLIYMYRSIQALAGIAVTGDATVNGNINIENTAGTAGIAYRLDGYGDWLHYYHSGGVGGGHRFVVNAATAVEIEYNYGLSLRQYAGWGGRMYIWDHDAGANWMVAVDNTARNLYFKRGATSFFWIKSNGRIGSGVWMVASSDTDAGNQGAVAGDVYMFSGDRTLRVKA